MLGRTIGTTPIGSPWGRRPLLDDNTPASPNNQPPGGQILENPFLIVPQPDVDSGRYFGSLCPGALTPPVLCSDASSFQQTLFLGATILDFSISLGYGEQSSSLTVKLVEDTCEGHSRVYYQGSSGVGKRSTLVPATTTKGDSFSPPPAGSPVYFRMGGFEFSGLLQSWTREKSTSGFPTYTASIIDPRELLDGTILVIGEEVLDPVFVSNVFNVYGVLERFGNECRSSPVLGFGGANVSKEGMPWNRILLGIHLLQSGLSSNR